MNYPKRLEKLQNELMFRNVDALVYGTGANFTYFTGLNVHWHRDSEPQEPTCFLLMIKGEEPRILLHAAWAHLADESPVPADIISTRYELLKALGRHLKGIKYVGTSQSAETFIRELLRPVLLHTQCVNAEHVGGRIRWIKEPEEIAFLRELNAMSDRVMETVVEHIRPGITQLGLQELVVETGLSLGAQDISFPPTAGFVKSGLEATENPFVYPKDKPLVPGSSISFDFGFIKDNYCTDYGRSFYSGPAPGHISKAYRALQESVVYLISRMNPGELKINQMFDVIEQALDERGYGDRLRARLPQRGLGHQIGVDLHETPRLRPDSDVWLKPGMVMAIEPKLLHAGEYYLRVEDIVLITETGAESLTTFDRERFELPTE